MSRGVAYESFTRLHLTHVQATAIFAQLLPLRAGLGGGAAVEDVGPEGGEPLGGREAQVALAVGAAGGQPEEVLVAAQGRMVVVRAGGVGGAGNDVLRIEDQRADLPSAGSGIGGQPGISRRMGIGPGDLVEHEEAYEGSDRSTSASSKVMTTNVSPWL
jgi:hypothetical protein